jgi:hypothetical protein
LHVVGMVSLTRSGVMSVFASPRLSVPFAQVLQVDRVR